MKKMVYLFDSTYKDILGIRKKSLMQTKAFFSLGYEPYLISKVNSAIEIYDYMNDSYRFISFNNTIEYYRIIFEFIRKINPDILYVRKQYLLNLFVMDFYKSVNEALPNTKMVLEIPTFPYDSEIYGTVNEKYIEIDKHYRKYLSEYFCFSTNFNNLDEVFGIKSLEMYNCIDIDSIKIKKFISKTDQIINLVTATSMGYWNGFERLITGIKSYYDKDYKKYGWKVYFHIAGEGPELGYYKKLTEEHNLNEYIKFYGVLDGEPLNNLYDIADFGILPLGLYKRKDSISGGIRMCEFCAKGIPLIYSGDTPPVFPPYSFEFPNDDSIIDVNKILDFYSTLQATPDYSKTLREHAENNFDWKMYIKRLIPALG